MLHLLILGIILGMGAAIPIGPVNLEIIRRNLRYGMAYGTVTGLGACGADVTYLILLCLGELALLQYPNIMRALGLIGSLILAWFACKAFHAGQGKDHMNHHKRPSLIRYTIEGYVITLFNPYTILFWASVGTQISLAAVSVPHAVYYAGAGVIIGTVGWTFVLNGLLHFTRHRLTRRTMRWLNYSGGIILLGFATTGILRVFGILTF